MDSTVVQLWSLAGTALGLVLVVAGMAWGCKQVTRQVSEIWRIRRVHQEAWLAAVDEPEDAIIRRFTAVSSLPPEVWSAFLTAFLEALTSALDTVVSTDSNPPTEADKPLDKATSACQSGVRRVSDCWK